MATLTSCIFKKKVFSEEKISIIDPFALEDFLMEGKSDYQNLKCKATAKILINQNKENSVKINFRITKDSLIWTNFSKSGVQLLTTMLSKDSIKLLKKINKKEYFFGTYKQLEKIAGTPISFHMIQDLIAGDPIMFNSEIKYYSSVNLNKHLLSSVKPKKISKLLKENEDMILYRYWIDPINFKCSKIEINDLQNKRTLVARFDDWKSFNSNLFPLKSELSFVNNEDTISISLDFNPNFKFNSNFSFPFNYSSNYTPIKLPGNE